MQRVMLFLDEQNVYRGARRAFFETSSPSSAGNVQPVQLGKVLCTKSTPSASQPRSLTEVRIYTGFPDDRQEPRAHSAYIRRRQAWEAAGAVVIDRPLKYPRAWNPSLPAQQKGVDVALALDFVTLALDGYYDVGILFSADTDLRPALEYVLKRTSVIAETASWWSKTSPNRLSLPGMWTWNHRLTRADYDSVADLNDYRQTP